MSDAGHANQTALIDSSADMMNGSCMIVLFMHRCMCQITGQWQAAKHTVHMKMGLLLPLSLVQREQRVVSSALFILLPSFKEISVEMAEQGSLKLNVWINNNNNK